MKIASILLLGMASIVTVHAHAVEVIHPFWTPSKSQIAFDTDYSFSRANFEHLYNDYAQGISEKLSYGLTDNWMLLGSVERHWMKSNTVRTELPTHNKYDMWHAGMGYNFINNGKHFLQATAEYGLLKHNSEEYEETGKGYVTTATYGYNFDLFTPYVKLSYMNSIDKGKNNDALWDATAAIYKKLTDNLGSTLALNYEHANSDETTSGAYTLKVDTAYMFTDAVSLKVFGEYLLNNQTRSQYLETQNAYSVGANLKVVF